MSYLCFSIHLRESLGLLNSYPSANLFSILINRCKIFLSSHTSLQLDMTNKLVIIINLK